jgi:Sap, sulfolipid-1-addressing protein
VIGSVNAPLDGVAAMGLAIGASPLGIVSVILLLNTTHPLRNAVSFALGWSSAIVVIGALSAKLFPPSGGSAPPPTWASVTEALIGLALLIVGWVQWRRRTAATPGAAEPAWMKRLQGVGPVLSFCLGAFLPTYALVFPAVQRIEDAHLPSGQAIVAFAVFLVLATIGLIVPIALYVFRPDTSTATLDRWRTWLLDNQRAAGAVLLFVVGVSLGLRGVQGLLV